MKQKKNRQRTAEELWKTPHQLWTREDYQFMTEHMAKETAKLMEDAKFQRLQIRGMDFGMLNRLINPFQIAVESIIENCSKETITAKDVYFDVIKGKKHRVKKYRLVIAPDQLPALCNVHLN